MPAKNKMIESERRWSGRPAVGAARMDKGKIYKKNPNMVSRVIAGETVLLPIYKTSEEISSIYTLNKAAAFVWDHINGKKSLAEIAGLVVREFDATPQEAGKGLAALIKDLSQIQAIATANASSG